MRSKDEPVSYEAKEESAVKPEYARKSDTTQQDDTDDNWTDKNVPYIFDI